MTNKQENRASTKGKKAASQPIAVPQPEATDAFHTALQELEGMRDDVRVRIHLAGMELKSAWDDLDKRYLSLRDVAMHAKDDALAKAKTGLEDVKRELTTLRGKLGGTGTDAAPNDNDVTIRN